MAWSLGEFFGAGTKAKVAAGVQEDAIAAQQATALAQLKAQKELSSQEIDAKYNPILAAQRAQTVKYIILGVIIIVVVYFLSKTGK